MAKDALEARRCNEILNACAALYQEKNFNEITLKDISAMTSISRPSIYNYFRTKEEIFLALLTREYRLWAEDIAAVTEGHNRLGVEEVANQLTRTLERREVLLKITSMNLYEIEDGSRIERLQAFKCAFHELLERLHTCVEKFLPEKKGMGDLLLVTFFPFLYGIYPFTSPTEKQVQAMRACGFPYRERTVYALVYPFLLRILKSEVHV